MGSRHTRPKASRMAAMSDVPERTPSRGEETPPEGASEVPLPQWLTEDFLQQALASDPEGARASLRVKGFHAQPAVGKGDNYGSCMLRVRVDIEGDNDGSEPAQRSLIVKSKPTAEIMRTLVDRMQLFSREQRIYQQTLPRMQELLHQRLRGRPIARLAPVSFFSAQQDVLVFEDLCVQGFKMAKRQSGLDMEHCLMVMRTMGTYHALSVAMHEEDPNSMNYDEAIYTEESRPEYEIMFSKTLELLADNVATWSGFESFAERMKNFGKSIVDVIMNLLANTKDRFKVLNHGDFWVNNMLFKYSDTTGLPTDMRLIDFQVPRFTSMAFDLQYFIFSSPNPEIRTEKMNTMLSAYHTTFSQVLRELDCEHRVVSLDDLEEELKRTLPFGLFTSCSILATILADPSDAIEVDGVTDEQLRSGEMDAFAKPMAGKTFQNAMSLLLPYFEQHGVL